MNGQDTSTSESLTAAQIEALLAANATLTNQLKDSQQFIAEQKVKREKEQEELRKLQKDLSALEDHPMRPLLEVTPLTETYDFPKLIKMFGGDVINTFGALLGQLEIPLKEVGISMGINQARATDGAGRESQAGISKKGSVELDSVSGLLHLPPQLLTELGSRGLVKIVLGDTSWVGRDDVVAQAGTTTAMSFTR